MTVTASLARRLAVAVLVLSAIAAGMVAALVATANGSDAPASAVVAVETTPAPAGFVRDTSPSVAERQLLAAIVGEGVDLPADQAEAFLLWADLTCEGFTAEVPVAVQTAQLMDELGLTGPEARHFVNTVAVVHCLLPAAR